MQVKMVGDVNQITWVNGSSNDTAKWIPGPIIKPIVEAVESFFSKILSGSKVEIRIKLVNHTLKSQHREETCGES